METQATRAARVDDQFALLAATAHPQGTVPRQSALLRQHAEHLAGQRLKPEDVAAVSAPHRHHGGVLRLADADLRTQFGAEILALHLP
ncbi:hypothetical protein ACFS07_06570 [Undibacterium arcticum]